MITKHRITIALSLLAIINVSTLTQASEKDANHPLSLIYKFVGDSGTSIYLSDENGHRHIKVLDAPNIAAEGYPAVSPSGKQLAFYGKYDDYKTWSIHIADIDGRNIKRLTHKSNVWDSAPIWLPDGNTIVFAREYKDSDGESHEEIWQMNTDGTEKHQIKGLQGRSPELLKDGRLLFQSKASPSQITIANMDGSRVVRLTNDTTDNMSPKISPDGSRIAYLSNRDGNQEVYTMALDGSEQNRLTFNAIQEWGPAWSRDGKHVFFSSQNVYGFYDLFKVNSDGSSIDKVLHNAAQAATVFHLDQYYLQRLLQRQSLTKNSG